MAQADWLLEVGVDTRTALTALTDFKKTADDILKSVGEDGIDIRLNTNKVLTSTKELVAQMKESINEIPDISFKIDLKGASRSLKALVKAIEDGSGTLNKFGYMLELLNYQIAATAESMARLAPIIREAAEDVRTISNYMRNAATQVDLATRSVQVYERALAALNSVSNRTSDAAGRASTGILSSGRASETASRGHKTQEDALHRLGDIFDNTVFKFVEYEVIMRAFNGVVHEFTDSLNEASNVQFQATLQKLYAPTVNFNDALKDSIGIARQWGSDITDVQQVIGMWVKLTNDETSAAYLANEAEKVRRASGMDTIDVYRDSVAIMQQMGITADKLPAIYDQVTNAALHLAEPLKNMGKGSNEGMKDLMDGLTKFGALGHSLGFDTSGVLAIVSNQIQTMSEHGEGAGSALSNMFGAMEQGGKSKFNFEKILGPKAFTGNDEYDKSLHILEAMKQKAPELAQAMADAGIKVKASGVEVEKALQASIDKVIKLAEELHKNSQGKLNLVADAEIKTFQGRVDQAKASVQQFSLAFGNYLLPAATRAIDVLNQGVLPALTANADKFVQFGIILANVGIGALGLQVFQRVGGYFKSVSEQVVKANTALANNAAATRLANLAGFDSVSMMEKVQAQLDLEAKVEAQLTEAIRLKGIQLGLTATALEDYVKATMDAKRASGELALAVDDTGKALERTRTASAGDIFKNVASSAMGAIKPLLEMYALVTSIERVAAGFDKKQVAQAQLSAYFDQKTKAPNPRDEGAMEELRDHPYALTNPNPRMSSAERQRLLDLPGALVHKSADFVTNIPQMLTLDTGKLKGDSPRMGVDILNNNANNRGDAGDEIRAVRKIMNNPNADDEQKKTAHQMLDDIVERSMHRNDGYDPMAATQKKFQDEWAEMQKHLRDTGGSTPDGHVKTDDPNANKGKASTEQQNAGEAARAVKDYQSLATEARDNAAAEKALADSIIEKSKATKISIQDVKDYAAALNEQRKSLQAEIQIRKDEINNLGGQLKNAEGDKSKQKQGTTAYEHAANTVASLQANIRKSTGGLNLLQNQLIALTYTDANLRAEFERTFDFKQYGLEDFTKKIEEAKKKVSSSSGYSDTVSNAHSGETLAQSGISALEKVAKDPKIAGNATAFAAVTQALREAKEALDEFKKSEVDADDKAKTFGENLKTIKDNVYAENTADIGKALGIDTGSMDALNTQIEIYKKMAEEIKSAGDDYGKSEKTPQDTANYNNLLNEIRERQQLAPLLEQEAKLKADIKKTEDSSTFKMVNEQVKNFGDKAIDNITKPLGKGFGGSLITGALKDTWATASKSITDQMFGVDKDKEKEITLQTIYKEHVDGLQIAAQEFRGIVNDMIIALEKVPGGSTAPGMANYGTDNTSPLDISNPSHALASMDYGSDSNNSVLKAIQGTDTNHADDALSTAQESRDYLAILSGQDGSRSGGTPSIANLGELSSSAGIGGAPTDGIPVKIASIASGGASSAASVVIPGVSAALGGVMKDAGLGGSTNPFTSLITGGMPALSKTLSGGVSKIMGNGGLTMGDIGLGIGVGDLSGTLFGGGSHTTNGEMGGALGSGLGALGTALGIFGPGGAILGALAGGVLGGMFGHADNVQAMPDKYDNNFAQETANLTGKSYTSEASGQQFMSANVAGSTAGQGEISSIEELMAKYPNPQDAPAWLQPYYTQAMSTFGASSTGSGVLKFGTDIANEHIAGAAGASQTDQNYQGINSLADQIEQAQALHTNQAQAPILSINAYGSNGAYGNSIYNTPGLTSDQFSAMQTNGFANSNLNNYYATPGVGTSTSGVNTNRNLESYGTASGLLGSMTLTTNLVVDGKTLATVVNAANAATASRTSTS